MKLNLALSFAALICVIGCGDEDTLGSTTESQTFTCEEGSQRVADACCPLYQREGEYLAYCLGESSAEYQATVSSCERNPEVGEYDVSCWEDACNGADSTGVAEFEAYECMCRLRPTDPFCDSFR